MQKYYILIYIYKKLYTVFNILEKPQYKKLYIIVIRPSIKKIGDIRLLQMLLQGPNLISLYMYGMYYHLYTTLFLILYRRQVVEGVTD